MDHRAIKLRINEYMRHNRDTPRRIAEIVGFTTNTQRHSHIYRCLNPDSNRNLNDAQLNALATHWGIPLITLTHGTEVIDTHLLATALADIVYHLNTVNKRITDVSVTQLSAASSLLYRARISDHEYDTMLDDLVGTMI